MAGIVPAVAHMTDRLTLGYREATVTVTSPLGPAGTRASAHEFHYASVDPPGDALDLRSRFGQGRAGFAGPRSWRRSSITTPGAIPRRSPRSWRRAGLHADGRFQSQLRQRNSR